MIADPITTLQPIVTDFLSARNSRETFEADGIIGSNVPWRPHLLERKGLRAWHFLTEPPEGDTWAKRILRARTVNPNLSIGLVGTGEILQDESLLEIADDLNAAILLVEQRSSSLHPKKLSASVSDFVYEERLNLTQEFARILLDRNLQRCLTETNKNRKGVLLEVLTAVLLSQVTGFDIDSVGISNRSQQMDVAVINRNVGGPLSGSPIVIAEAKNWTNPVEADEYALFVRKLQSRHGRAKLGYFVTTDRFTEGVRLETRRESMGDTLVVLLDEHDLPRMWRDDGGITVNIEKITLKATVGK